MVMHRIVHIQVLVKPEFVEAFIEASRENACNSVLAPGIARFYVLQQPDDPTRFVFIEMFRTPDAQEAHRQTAHYQAWREAVAEMMAEPRKGANYVAV